MSSARVVFAACILLAGCGGKALDPKALSKAQARSLVLAFDRSHCHVTSLYDDGYGGFHMRIPGSVESETETALTWLHAVSVRDRYSHVGTKFVGSCITSMDVRSPTDGWTIFFRGCARLPTDGSAGTLTGCVATPSDVSILDITPDAQNPKRATVLYVSVLAPTSIGKVLAEPGSANDSGVRLLDLRKANHDALNFPTSTEYRASLQRLDATGWRVDDTTFFHPDPR
ncbi:hypothetical protein [Phenylobacterium aquaticum]|uniref:hypothetical protein n=1 Tax=Phenylobacterium aquaticum TaxID=1763816 RepID=UPI001F5C2F6E|nr:hypothetical protein [Phenylobacterium aquaticum]MCI3133150.1 hypothetical protein [Phenylobacterium aquaticum]